MKVFLLSDAGSPHTLKWVKALTEAGIKIHLFSLSPFGNEIYSKINNVSVETFGLTENISSRRDLFFSKFIYLFAVRKIKKRIKEFKPDILHSHYASSYGLVGSLTNFHPFFISVWGSDVYEFPRVSFISRIILKYVLSKADKVFSTSNVMAKETKLYTNKRIEVIPFGVDLEMFLSRKEESIEFKKEIIIGTIKKLERIYGIDTLIRAFKILIDKIDSINIRLIIVGGGSLEKELKALSHQLQLDDKVDFIGKVDSEQVIKYYHKIDIAVFLSKQESFGVSVIEAMACGIPVIVSKAEGFKEIVSDNESGIFVESENINETAEALEKLILNENLRKQLGVSGRKKVEECYNWKKNAEQMIQFYKQIK